MFEKKYYEEFPSWGGEPSALDQERIVKIIKLIPPDVSTILDLGCGDGKITNELRKVKKWSVIGADWSTSALKYVQAPRICCDVSCTPFKDKIFDLVLCAEVLEHLPSLVYQKALKEIQRVSRKYIIASVPYEENLNLSFIKCPKCGYRFHPSMHQRSFKKKELEELFNEFILLRISGIGKRAIYPNIAVKLAKSLGFGSTQSYAVCPNCGLPLINRPCSKSRKTSLKNKLQRYINQIHILPTKNEQILALFIMG